MFGRCWKEKMLGSHLRAVADAQSLGVCSTIAVKPRGPRFFSWSLWIKHPAQDCQNPFCHGGKKTDWKAVIQFTGKKERQKSHFALTFRTNVFTQQFLVSYFHRSMFTNVSYFLTIHELHSGLWEACCSTTYFMSYMLTARTSCILFFLKSKSKNMRMETKDESNVASVSGKNKHKTTWPQALSSMLERLMSVPEDPKLK